MPTQELDLLAVASSFSRFAGPNNPILDLLNVLSGKTGSSVAVMTTSALPESDFAEAIRFPVYRELDGVSGTLAERAGWVVPNILRAKQALRRLNPRRLVVFSNVDTAFEVASAVGGPIVAGYNVFFNVPHVGWVERLGLPLPRRRTWKSALFRTADLVAAKTIVRGIFAHSEFHKRLYLDVGIAEDRIRVVPQCIDTGRILRSAGPETAGEPERIASEATVLYAGRLDPDKGAQELIDAAEDASREVPIRLQVVGNGSLEKSVRERSMDRTSPNLRIESMPSVGPARLFPMMRSADIIAIPSWVEAFGMVALEAMTLGTPIVATRFGGIAEVIRNGQDGLLVNPFNRKEFATALVTLALDTRLRHRLAASARARVKETFEASVVAPKFLQALGDLE
jgi:glycosyltransferase involved in cell wall biosynthesis